MHFRFISNHTLLPRWNTLIDFAQKPSGHRSAPPTTTMPTITGNKNGAHSLEGSVELKYCIFAPDYDACVKMKENL